jgi:hypothetical protein
MLGHGRSRETGMAMSWRLLAALAMEMFVVAAVAAPTPQIAIDQLPRPTARTAAADKIATVLADKDAEFRRAATDCRAEAGQHGFEYRVGARRLLESSTLYSVEIAASWDCGGAHPDQNATALTFDLQTGTPYDLNRIFHIGSGHLADAAVPILMKYLKPVGDCVQVTSKDDLQRADISLGVTNANLILYFGVEHVIAACYPPVQVPFAALASLADQAELQRLGPPFITASCPAGNWVGLAMIGKELPRVGFVSPSTEKLPECPSATPACRLASYLVPGDRVLVGESVDGFRCVTFRSASGRETNGFLPSAALVDQSTVSPTLADWAGRWARDDEASITIKVEGAALTVSGQATWGAHDPARVKRGGVNTGDIDSVATPRGNLIAIGAGYDGTNPPDVSNINYCLALLQLFGPYLAVEDNTGCGGMNVTFTGVYLRQR